jgi:uncharacterized protein (DUF1501 family)
MFNTTRRDFLRAAGLVVMAGAGGYLSAEQLYAAAGGSDLASKGAADAGGPEDRQRPTLVTIFLRGGADALNAFVPAADPLYYKYRPRIGLKVKGENGSKGLMPVLKSDYWGLNPHMEPLLPLMEEGKAVPIINVGSPNGTRSHFSAQDFMERGCPGDTTTTTGWLNRYLAASKRPYDAPLRGLSAMTLVPRALRGPYPVLAGNNNTDQMEMFEHLYSPQNLVNMTAREGVGAAAGSSLSQRPTASAEVARPKGLTSDATRDIITESGANAVERIKAMEKAYAVGNEAMYPGGPLASQLATIARVIKANVGLEVAQADYDGWDHHSAQGGVDGQHSRMLNHLTACLRAFHDDLGKRMDKVLVLVMSEFGRTLHENGSNGTDHGRAGFMIAVGGMLNGGKFYGTHKGLDDTDYGRFQPVHTDFRAVFAESLSKLFHFDPFKAQVFPGYRAGG